ncbi:MAG: riboflavin synthase [bacterium]
MFTGLVEEVGVVRQAQRRAGAIRLTVAAKTVLQDLAVDASIAVSGVCLTVVSVAGSTFDLEAVQETLRKTTLGALHPGSKVNLERALRFADRLGGHLVQGHVDSVGEVVGVHAQAAGTLLSIRLPPDKMKYVISEGSIAVDGVSLTVARIKNNEITISLIPHTSSKTTLGALTIGDPVNIEVDLVGKYVENILMKSEGTELSENRLRALGFHT